MGVRTIELPNGLHALVDEADFTLVDGKRWGLNSEGYVIWRTTLHGERYMVGMHRVIMGLSKGDGVIVDHINGNVLDNRRTNLRLCTRAENSRNRRVHAVNKVGLKGVSAKRKTPTSRVRWIAQITVSGRKKHLGRFDTPELAHEFYCLAADMLHGDFSNHG
jgi:hypothetical protein